MILTSQRKMKSKHITAVLLLFLMLIPQGAFGAGLALSVTPTLFEMSAVPLQAWSSSIKVINTNEQALTVYANVVNFAPRGETGQGKFLPVFENFTEGETLAEWITVSEGPYVIPSESSMSIPLVINVPDGASPGGHYAAIMIGTKPLSTEAPFQVATAQVVTSLFFVRIAGDVVEDGAVRTFRAVDSFVDTPEVSFEIRFENKGNVHLQPQGEIVITNMWGKERGIVPINRQTHFGNVLPDSVRKFNFTWKGEQSFTDIGRYKAVLTLAYGQDSRKFLTQSTYFWVVPVKAVLLVLGSLAFIVWFLSWSIRSYVRRMLAVSGVQQGYVPLSQRSAARTLKAGDVLIGHRPSVSAPLTLGVTELKSGFARVHAFKDTVFMLVQFVNTYKKFFGSIAVFVLLSFLVWYYFAQVTTQQRDYEVTIENPDAPVTISSEEIMYNKEVEQSSSDQSVLVSDQIVVDEQRFELILINSSDTPGAAGSLQKLLTEEYTVTALKSDFEETKARTVIVYDVEVQDEALALSKILDGALLSASPQQSDTDVSTISIYIGNDYLVK